MTEIEFEHRFIKTNGVQLHVVEAGPNSGRAVILLHGFPEFWRGWIKQIPPLADAGYHVIVPDQRGYNLSDVPKRVIAYSLAELAQDVIGLMDHFGYKKVSLVGHDWGAAVAWMVAMTYPSRIERLTILNVPHPAVMLSFLKKSPRQMLRSWYVGFFQIPLLADWLLSVDNFSNAIRMLRVSGKKGTFAPSELTGYKTAWSNSGGLTGMLNWYRALLRSRLVTPADTHLHMPVLILWGRQDIALGSEMAEASLKLCDDGKLVFFEDATHWVQHDEAEQVNTQLLEFLGMSRIGA
jgi:epoxide hydrolase 4